jgi:rhodanese-related sulfurtransferase
MHPDSQRRLQSSLDAGLKSVFRGVALFFVVAVAIGMVANIFSAKGVRAQKAGNAGSTARATLETPPNADGSAVANEPVADARALSWRNAISNVELGNAILVDVRGRHEYQASHVPGAVSLPHNAATPEMAQFANLYAKDRMVVLYCNNEVCPLANKVAKSLQNDWGFTAVFHVPGGFDEYLEQFSDFHIARHTSRKRSDGEQVDWSDAAKLISDGAILIDARSSSRFAEGHIPGAVSIPYGSGADAIANFRDKYGVDRALVVYCESRGCPLSAKLAYVLSKEFNFGRVYHVTTGYREWATSNRVVK